MGSDRLDALCNRYAAALCNPPPPGPGVCRTCRGPAPAHTRECSSCRRVPSRLDAVLPISWSVASGPLHRALRGYKDDPLDVARREFAAGLAAVLERFLRGHEACAAAAAGVAAFTLVTTVPARADRNRGPLRTLVRGCPSTAGRFARSLVVAGGPCVPHRFDPERFRALRPLAGETVLLVDDTWTSGATAQSAAHALKRAGARRVALVVIGRHVNPSFGDQAARCACAAPFRWDTCAAHAG
jgi:predicted amidophosphoribosyltransferase